MKKTVLKNSPVALSLLLMLAGTHCGWALPKIKVLATGGTIAGAQASQADAGYKSGSFSVDNRAAALWTATLR